MGRMAKSTKKTTKKRTSRKPAPAPQRLWRRALRWGLRGAAGFAGVLVFWIMLYVVINPPTTPYMLAESWRLGGIEHEWVDLEDIDPVMARAAVAAEDANFCLHWGFDMAAIRQALEGGANRGASTITQQVVKNVFLWQGRSWPRKALEALMTPVVELFWTKRRILEVYLNVVEMGEGRFGVEAAARGYFRVGAGELSPTQAARIAAILPDPKDRNAANPTAFLRRRAAAILDGAATIRADGRATCFED